MDAMTLAAHFLHVPATDPWEVLALVGPFGVVFGAGVILVIIPIVRAGGDRYQHRELRGDEQKPHANGNKNATPSPPVGEGRGGGYDSVKAGSPTRPPPPGGRGD